MDLMAWLLAAFGGDMHSQEQDCAELSILSFEMERFCHRKGGSSSWCVMRSVVCGVPWSVCLCVFVCMRGCLCLFTCTGMMMDIVAKLESHSSFLPVCLLSPCIHLKLSTSSQVRPSPAQHKPQTISVKAKINCCADLNIHIYKYIQTYMWTFYKPRINKLKKVRHTMSGCIYCMARERKCHKPPWGNISHILMSWNGYLTSTERERKRERSAPEEEQNKSHFKCNSGKWSRQHS